MAEAEKMFTFLKSGMNIKINPRNAAGWRALGLWMAAFFAMLGLYMLGMSTVTSAAMHGGLTALFVLATAIWTFAMIRWMMARSEVIDVKELLALKRELDRQKQNRR